MSNKVYYISNIEEFGKLMAFCIDNGISVDETHWNEREKGDRCYRIDWQLKSCLYAPRSFYEHYGPEIITPNFSVNERGEYEINETPCGVVRCRNCEYHHSEQEPCHGKTEHFCSVLKAQVYADFYCAHGKRKEVPKL